MDDATIERRRIELGKFLEQCTANETIRRSALLSDFIELERHAAKVKQPQKESHQATKTCLFPDRAAQRQPYAAGPFGFREAVKLGDLVFVTKKLKEEPRYACFVDGSGTPVLHLACIFKHSEIVMELLAAGADPLFRNSHGETAVDIAPPALRETIRSFS